MDLFTINRYVGDDKEDKDYDEKSKLATLFSKIETRKKQRELIKSSQANISTECDNAIKIEPLQGEGDLEIKTEITKKKKRKKQKSEENIDSQKDDDNENIEINKTDDAENDKFTVIGINKFKKKQKVKRVLPHWLANPSLVSVNLQNLTTRVKDIKILNRDLQEELRNNDITHFFPVQAQVIPWILTAYSKPAYYWPRDVCVSAPTGSGKTLAFVLPIVQVLQQRLVTQVRALVILPIQDLATQIYNVFLKYTQHTDLKVVLITGQTPFHKEQLQLVASSPVHGYCSLVDIIVTTPGRLVDHLRSTQGFSLKHLKFLVIDEADCVIENNQNDWLYHVYSHINSDNSGSCKPPALTISALESADFPPPHKLLFSATLTQDPEKLQQLGLFQPKLFSSIVENNEAVGPDDTVRGSFISKYTTPAELSEYKCVVSPEIKPIVLYHLVTTNNWKHVLVFVDSRKDVHRLSFLIQTLGKGKLRVSEISASLERQARERILSNFASGELDMIISSDALARGMDIEVVDYVILYSAPKSIKNYIHRVGRTGRAGKQGTAVTLLLENQVTCFNEILHRAGKHSVQEVDLKESDLIKYEEAYKEAIVQLKNKLESETTKKLNIMKHNKKVDPLKQKLKKKKKYKGKIETVSDNNT